MASVRQYQTDVAIVGAGGAGVAAGIEAHDAGARAIVFEQSAELGGAAIVSGGGCLIVGSPLQKQNGIHDTPDLAFKDWIAWGGASADQVWARYYIEHTLHDLYHWAEGLGVRWVDMKVQEGNSVIRWTRAERNGLGLMTHLIEAFRSRGGEVVAGTEITALRVADGRVTGLEGRDARTGEPVAVKSKAVVVTTGGFNSNLDMVIEFKRRVYELALTELSRFLPRTPHHTRYLRAGIRGRSREPHQDSTHDPQEPVRPSSPTPADAMPPREAAPPSAEIP